MFKKLSATILSVFLLVSVVSAQNARVHSLGGVNIIDDIFTVIGFPAYMNDYSDVVQASSAPGGVGPIFGIKSLGDVINLGFVAQQGSYLRSDFYNDGRGYLGSTAAASLPGAFPAIPNLLFGLDLDNFQLGVDFFADITSARTNSDDGTTETESKARVSNIGGVVSANLNLGSLIISPAVTLGFPRINGVEDDGIADAVEYESEKGLMFSAGSEFGIETYNVDIVAGAFYTLESYQFKTDGTDSDFKYPNNYIDIYAGFIADIFSDILWVSQYNLNMEFEKEIDESAAFKVETTNKNTTHMILTGFERPISDFLFLDTFTPRAGLAAAITSPSTKTVEETAGDDEITNEDAANTYNVAPRLGLGITKGRASVDVSVDLGNWAGTISGPNVFRGTLTLDFGSDSYSSSSSSYGGSSYDSGSSYESTDTDTEESGSDMDSGSSSDESDDMDFDF